MELYIKSVATLDEIGSILSSIVTKQGFIAQKRFGLNLGGGEYYLFEKDGDEVILCMNRGEVEVPEATNYQFYLWVYEGTDKLLEHFQIAANSHQIENEYRELL